MHQLVTAAWRVAVAKALADAAQPSQVQQPSNMPVVVAPSGMSQQSDRSKAVAEANMDSNVVTRLTAHADTSLLKDVAEANVLFMVVTLLTSHADTSLLKDDAP